MIRSCAVIISKFSEDNEAANLRRPQNKKPRFGGALDRKRERLLTGMR
jgi:hypothetical protein